jgi:hypothetical protein
MMRKRGLLRNKFTLHKTKIEEEEEEKRKITYTINYNKIKSNK